MYFGAKVIILRSGKKYLMEKTYTYFDRNVSWLSFNYRVLLEAEDINMPIYERLMFLSIHASNLEEFYKIRVAEHRSLILRKKHSNEDSSEEENILKKIKSEVTRQQKEFYRILQDDILPELKKKNIILYMDEKPTIKEHTAFIHDYFKEEIFPYLQPVLLFKDDIRFFIRDNRIYQVVQLRGKDTKKIFYAIIKIPYAKVPRFIDLPEHNGKHYYMFVEDIIAANLHNIFIGYDIEGCYNIKISRDADIYIEDSVSKTDIVQTIIKKVKKRKIGDLSRFVYDRRMPRECIDYLCNAFEIVKEDLIPDNPYLSLEDLIKLPNPMGKDLEEQKREPIRMKELDKVSLIFPVIKEKDLFFYYPYHSFDYFIRFLHEASTNPDVEEIKVTQYRVAENSEVINNLINAAKNGKKVTVFVELQARFDEENNLYTANIMKEVGITIIYSLPGLKVHAKAALVIEKKKQDGRLAYAYLSTGNFNEKTATRYADMAIMTSEAKLTEEINKVFEIFESHNKNISFKNILVAQFNMVSQLKQMIHREIEHVSKGKKGYIILKMNGLQDPAMIDELYKASEAGVEIDLIVRGICSLVPNQEYSKNIRVTRIVDQYLEHSRIWYFYNDGQEDLFLSSADWMRRNLYRRIETAFPIYDENIKHTIINILTLQLKDNVKACFIDGNLHNIFKRDDNPIKVRAQQDTYNLLKE